MQRTMGDDRVNNDSFMVAILEELSFQFVIYDTTVTIGDTFA